MNIRVSEFKNRDELDRYVAVLVNKTDYAIVGTELELKALQLSETTTVWGVPCKIILGDKVKTMENDTTGAVNTAEETTGTAEETTGQDKVEETTGEQTGGVPAEEDHTA